jgi:hypothetical protein
MAFRLFLLSLEHIAKNPTNKITREYLSAVNTNYGQRQAMLSGMKSMGLIDSNGVPQDRLRRLLSPSEEIRRAALREGLASGFPYLMDEATRPRLPTLTADDFREIIAKEALLRGSSSKKCLSFFVMAARHAGLEIHPDLYMRKIARRDSKNAKTSAETGLPNFELIKDPEVQREWLKALVRIKELEAEKKNGSR